MLDDLAPMVWRDPEDKRDDRERIDAAFRKLRKLNYAAYMSVESAPVESVNTPTVYWFKEQDVRVFGSGELRTRDLQQSLWLYWHGNIAEIVATLESEGLRVVVSEYTQGLLSLLPMPLSPQSFVPKPGAIEARDYRRGCYVCGSTGEHNVRSQLRKTRRKTG
jgi:hypothetical protein